MLIETFNIINQQPTVNQSNCNRYFSQDELFAPTNIKKYTLGAFDKMFKPRSNGKYFEYEIVNDDDYYWGFSRTYTKQISFDGIYNGKSIYACVRNIAEMDTSVKHCANEYQKQLKSIPESVLLTHPSFNPSDYVCVVENIPLNERTYQTFINYDNIKTLMLFVFEGNMLKLSKCKLLFKTFLIMVAKLWGFVSDDYHVGEWFGNLPSIYHQMMDYMQTYRFAKIMLKKEKSGMQKLLACNNNIHRLWHNGLLQYKPYVFHIKTIPFLLICHEGVVAGNEQYDDGAMVIGNDYLLRHLCKFL